MSQKIYLPAFLAALLLTLSCGHSATSAVISPAALSGQVATTTPRSSEAAAEASIIRGRVVGVSDGDTVTVLDAGRRQHKIRLLGVDAPEKDQDFGERSKQNLSDLVYFKDVAVEYKKQDGYGRTLGKVLVGGKSANLEQVRAGLAWFYRHYADDVPKADRAALDEAEREARQSKKLFEKSYRLEATQHQACHGKVNERLAGLSQSFIVFAQAATVGKPREGALHHRPAR